jgi:hypothetical protein
MSLKPSCSLQSITTFSCTLLAATSNSRAKSSSFVSHSTDGAKQSSALFYKLLNSFLLSLGFVSSTLDACFYKRHDALIIVHVNDMHCAGTSNAVAAIHAALFSRFKITTSDGNRFLGMDTHYDPDIGTMTM